MKIGELAKTSGVGVETVRFYEQKGLIEQPPRPVNGGYRRYPEEVAARIKFIRNAQHLGFSLVEVAELLELDDRQEEAGCADFRKRAQAKRLEVESKLDDLNRIKSALDALISACPNSGSTANCSILNALKTGDSLLKSRRVVSGPNGSR